MMIALGQLVIFISVRSSDTQLRHSRAQLSNKSENSSHTEVTLARRLATVVVSDFLCWFPLGVLGLMASNGHPVPGEVNVAMVIFVLPLNSALNPFLYTLNSIMEKRRADRMKRLISSLEVKLKNDCKNQNQN